MEKGVAWATVGPMTDRSPGCLEPPYTGAWGSRASQFKGVECPQDIPEAVLGNGWASGDPDATSRGRVQRQALKQTWEDHSPMPEHGQQL